MDRRLSFAVPRLLLLFAVLLLPACSYFDTEEPVDASQQIDLTKAQHDQYGLQPIEQVIRNQSNGSVELYNLDEPMETYEPEVVPSVYKPEETSNPSAMAVETREPITRPQREITSEDPSVEVYPLDGPAPASRSSSVQSMFDSRSVYDREPITAPKRSRSITSDVSQSAVTPDDLVIVTFDHGSVVVDSGDLDILEAYSADYSGGEVSVVGHASVESVISDPVERKISNLQISTRRAFNVAQVLIEKGIPADLVRVEGVGEFNSGDDAHSRRVEISSQPRH